MERLYLILGTNLMGAYWVARGVFTSVKDLARKFMRYIRLYNKAPKPVDGLTATWVTASVRNQLLQATSVLHSRQQSASCRIRK
jgi:hypothetical protein